MLILLALGGPKPCSCSNAFSCISCAVHAWAGQMDRKESFSMLLQRRVWYPKQENVGVVNSACWNQGIFAIGVNGGRVFVQWSALWLLTCSVGLSHAVCLWQGVTWDALWFPFDLLYILLCTPISFENKMLCECLTGSFSFTDLLLWLKSSFPRPKSAFCLEYWPECCTISLLLLANSSAIKVHPQGLQYSSLLSTLPLSPPPLSTPPCTQTFSFHKQTRLLCEFQRVVYLFHG